MLTQDEKTRYARQMILPGFGAEAQAKLKAAKVLVIGAGGLGSPLLYYLVAAGVGNIRLVDDDRVSLNNLHRQILFETSHINEAKVEAAKEALLDLNPLVNIEVINERFTAENADVLLEEVDIVADGCDSIETRFLVADKAAEKGIALVSAAVHQWQGQLSTFKPYLGEPHPSYRCLYPEAPPADAMPSCADAGILGAVAGVMGSLQAAEVVKELTGLGESLSGYLLRIDCLKGEFRKVKLTRNPLS